MFPFQLHFRGQILTQLTSLRAKFPLCGLFLLTEANKGVMDYPWPFFTVQKNINKTRCPKALDAGLEFPTKKESIYFQ